MKNPRLLIIMIMTSLCFSAYGLKPQATLSNKLIEEPQQITIYSDAGDSVQYNDQSLYQRLDDLEKKVESNQYQNGLMVNSINNILTYSMLFFSLFLSVLMLSIFLVFIFRNRKRSERMYDNAMNGYFSSAENQVYLFKSMFTLLLEQNQKIEKLYLESKARYPVISAAYDSDQNPFPKKPNLEDAMSDYDRAIEIDPKKTKAYLERGMLKMQLGDVAGAMSDYDKAIEIDDNNPNAYIERGRLKMQLGDVSGALEDFDKSICLNPNNPKAYIERSKLKSIEKDYEGAIHDIVCAIKLDSNNADSFIALAEVEEKLGQFDRAVHDLTTAITLNPSSKAYAIRANIYKEMGDIENAVNDYQKGMELSLDKSERDQNER